MKLIRKIARPGRLKQNAAESSGPPPVTTLHIFQFEGRNRLWAFLQMGWSRPLLWITPGLRFSKLLGSGQGLVFSLKPDWGRYALLAVWDNEEAARRFMENSIFIGRYRRKAARTSWVMLRTLSAHGRWNGRNPFLPVSAAPATGEKGPLAVLTRATIRPTGLRAFWRQAPHPAARLEQADGLLASIGIGEAPFLRQATFSIWQDRESMQNFAYQSPEHREAIRLTRETGWYSEELFARFEIIDRSEIFP